MKWGGPIAAMIENDPKFDLQSRLSELPLDYQKAIKLFDKLDATKTLDELLLIVMMVPPTLKNKINSILLDNLCGVASTSNYVGDNYTGIYTNITDMTTYFWIAERVNMKYHKTLILTHAIEKRYLEVYQHLIDDVDINVDKINAKTVSRLCMYSLEKDDLRIYYLLRTKYKLIITNISRCS